jgi:hypothetical protein
MTLTSFGLRTMFDTGDLDVRMYSGGISDTYSCNAPRNSLTAGGLFRGCSV